MQAVSLILFWGAKKKSTACAARLVWSIVNSDKKIHSMINTKDNDFGGPTSQFQDTLSSLKYYHRVELIRIVNESNLLLMVECAEMVRAIPEEIWKIIFEFASEMSGKRFAKIEYILQKISCVSRSWSGIIRGITQSYFKESRYYERSNWVLGQFLYLEVLDLHNNSYIRDRALRKLTNLTSLNLEGNVYITNYGVKKLTKLKILNLTFNSIISDQGITKMTNLTVLNISRNSVITDHAIAKLTNLKELHLLDTLFYNTRISDRGIGFLTNLTHLDLRRNLSISDEGVKKLTNLRKLLLDENFSQVTKEGLKYLTNLNSL